MLQMKKCEYAISTQAWVMRLDKSSSMKDMVSSATAPDAWPRSKLERVGRIKYRYLYAKVGLLAINYYVGVKEQIIPSDSPVSLYFHAFTLYASIIFKNVKSRCYLVNDLEHLHRMNPRETTYTTFSRCEPSAISPETILHTSSIHNKM